MSDIRMSNIFDLPISYTMKDNLGNNLDVNDIFESKAIAHAINSHDKLTEQNKMLQTRIDMFTKAINQIADSVSAGVCAGVDTDGDISHTSEVIIGAHTKLAEQNKMMIEALKLIAKIAEHPPVDKLILKEANQALGATK